ncbi:MAG: hypothetical protein NTU58_00275 [Candidatus Nealsonbacteria bacterium]|nr:hypothetical protein [Candidatus Nealsonbacteria bacterium]
MESETCPKIKKVIFYTNIPRVFRTTQIGHFYEITHAYPTILLSEKLDSETENIIADKKLFPRLEKIIPVHQFTGEKKGLFAKNRYLYNLAKDAILKCNPDIVISPSDIHSLFEMYLLRFAKKIGALRIIIQPSNIGDSKNGEKFVDLTNAYLRFPSFLPLKLRLFLTRCRKYLGHFLYYWILPLLVLERPFSGKASYILRKGNIGMGDSDYLIVFSEKDRQLFLKEGVRPEKIYILAHPLARESRKVFKNFFINISGGKKAKNFILVLLSSWVEIGFRRDNCHLISREERYKKWKETIGLITGFFPDWEIIIKHHPKDKDIERSRLEFEPISKNIKIINPKEQLDEYIDGAKIIIGLPLSASTSLYIASLKCPRKPILSLDFHREILGDYYKNFEGIEHIDSELRLSNILELIKKNKYQKKLIKKNKAKKFKDTVELLNYLYKIKHDNAFYGT